MVGKRKGVGALTAGCGCGKAARGLRRTETAHVFGYSKNSAFSGWSYGGRGGQKLGCLSVIIKSWPFGAHC